MIIKATPLLKNRIDLSSLEQLGGVEIPDNESFKGSLGPGQSIEIDDKWYPIANIQGALKSGLIEVELYRTKSDFEVITQETTTENYSFIEVQVVNLANYPQTEFEQINKNFRDLDEILDNLDFNDTDISDHINDNTIHFTQGEIAITESQISDLDKYTQNEVDNLLDDKANDADISTVGKTGDYDDLNNKPDLSTFEEVLVFPTLNDFPANGEPEKIYISASTNIMYRWDGSAYVILAGEVGDSAIWGEISGTLSDQTDLQNALNLKANESDLSAHIDDIDNPHDVTKDQVGLSNVDNVKQATKTEFDDHTNDSTIHFAEGSIDHTNIQNIGVNTHTQIDSHIDDVDKHRGINDLENGLTDLWSANKISSELDSKADDSDLSSHVGETSIHFTQSEIDITESQINDLDKYTQGDVDLLLDAKAEDADLTAHVNDLDNPHNVSQGQVGLDQVDNTSDMDKPVSTAQQSALDLKANDADISTVGKTGNYNDLNNKPDLSALEEVLVFSTLNDFPANGEVEKVYIAEDTGYMYRWNGSGYTQLTDQTAIWGQISGVLSDQTDLQSALNLKADDSDLSAHVNDVDNPHNVNKSQVGLSNVDNVQQATKVEFDSHTSDSTIHFTQAQISITESQISDLDKYTQLEVDNLLDGKTDNTDFQAHANDSTIHFTEGSIDHANIQNIGINTHAQIDSHISDVDKHREINDLGNETTDLWSASKIDSELSLKADDSDLSAHVNDTDNPHSVTKSQVGLGNVDNIQQATKVEFDSHTNDSTIHFAEGSIDHANIQNIGVNTHTQIDAHISDDNKHREINDLEIGLTDLWSASKIDSELNEKAEDSDLSAHVSDTDNPHTVTKSQVGLGNVDNTSDLDKPISNDTQNALDLKANDADISVVGKTGNYNDLNNKPDLSALEEVLVFPTLNDFPVTGEAEKVYIAEDTGYMYRWNGTDYTQLTDQTAIWGQISGTLSDQTDLQSALNFKADDSDLSSHISDTDNPHNVTKSQIGLGNVDNVQQATKTEFDAHENDSTIHFTESQISITESQISDLDKYTQLEVDNLLDGKTDNTDFQAHANDSTIHFTENSIDHVNIQNIGINTHAQIDSHISDDGKHREINDVGVGATDLWSASKIDSELNLKAEDSDLSAHVSDTDNPHSVTKSQVGLGNVDNVQQATKVEFDSHANDSTIHFTEGSIDHANIQNIGVNTHVQIDSHISDIDKHREINDLGNQITDLWSASKIDSELNLKADDSDLSSHIGDTDNPHSVTKSQVGLGNVDNTADLDKPISNDTQNALDLKANDADISVVGKTGNYNDLNNKPDLSALEEVLVFPTLNDFPVTGEAEKVYIAEDTGYMYRWNGNDYTQLTDQTAIWGQISGTLSDQTDLQNALNLKADDSDLNAHVSDIDNPHAVTKSQVGLGNVDNVQQATKVEFDSHANDLAIHFTEGSIDHANIQNIGVNTHSQIDSHISDDDKHREINDLEIGLTDLWSASKIDSELNDKADDSDLSSHVNDSTIHFTEGSIDHANIQGVGINTHAQIDSHISDDDKHREINDLEAGLTDLWSASKIDSELNLKAEDSDLSTHINDVDNPHAVTKSQVGLGNVDNVQQATKVEFDSHANDATIHFTEGSIDHANIQNIGVNTHAQIDSHISDDDKHREINDLENGLTDLWSANKIDSELSAKADDSDLSSHVNDSTIHFTEGSIDHANIQGIGVNTHTQIDSHISDDDKHREINDLEIGLTDLWSASKIDSELDSKANDSDLSSHINDTDNPHTVTKSQVGLGNVDNTSDLDKPISNDTQSALDLKANDADISTVGKTGDYNDLNNKPDLSALEEVLVFPTLNDFPATGEVEKVYIAEDTGYMYRWNGNDYTQLTDQTAIWGQISGTLSDQTDLNNALSAKADDSDLSSHISDTDNPHNVTKSQVGLENVDNVQQATKVEFDSHANDSTIHFIESSIDHTNIQNIGVNTHAQIDSHISDADKHREINDLGNQITDLWSASKIDSELNDKADDSDLSSHVSDTDNPHNVTKSQVGLSNVDNVQQATKVEFDSHTNDSTIHFTEGSIDHTNIQNVGVNTHAQIDSHISDADKHREINDLEIGLTDLWSASKIDSELNEKADDSDLSSHTSDSTIHFTEGSIDHANIQNIGTNTHAQIDSHISDDDKHREINDLENGLTDLWSASKISSELNEKADDSDLSAHVSDIDNPHNVTKSQVGLGNVDDVQQATKTEFDSHANDSTIHFTEGSIDHANIQNIGVNTHTQIDSHISDVDKHREINDSETGLTDLWSANKISSELNEKADDSDLSAHVNDSTIHFTQAQISITESQISDLDKYTQLEVDNLLDDKADDSDLNSHVNDSTIHFTENSIDHANIQNIGVNTHAQIDSHIFDDDKHREINDLGNGITDLWSASKIDSELNDKADESDLSSHVSDTDNPHTVTKSQVGLGNVDNTSDLDKPISNDTQDALDLKANDADISTVGKTGDYSDLNNKPDLSALEEVLVFPTLNDFPANGEVEKVYIAEDTGYMYRWNGTDYTQLTDQTAIWGQISGNLSDQTDLNSALNAKADDSDLSSHVNDTDNPHSVTKSQVGLGNVDDVQQATKVEFDSHANDSTIHFTQAQINITESQISDLDKYTQVEVDNLLDEKTDETDFQSHVDDSTIHFTEGSIDHVNIQNIGVNTHAQIDSHISNDDKHREINDLEIGLTDLWSASKIDSELNLKADDSDLSAHTNDSTIHFTEGSIDHANIQNVGVNTHAQIDAHISDDDKHREINDLETGLTDLWSASKIDSELNEKADDSDLNTHVSDTDNPHAVTKSQVGLGNVDNTSDLDKPISNDTQDALDLKANDADISTVGKTGNYNDLNNKPDLSALEEVLVFPTLNDFPVTGEVEKVYIAEDTGYMYRWNGTDYTQLTDQTAIWGQISGVLSDQTDLQNALNLKADDSDLSAHVSDTDNPHNVNKSQVGLSNVDNIQQATKVEFDSHANDTTIHFTEGSIDHANIQNIGINTHAQIDSHISDSDIHFTQAQISILESQISDLDKYTQLQVDNLLDEKTDDTDFQAHTNDSTIHFTESSIDHANIQNIGINTHAQIDAHISDDDKHREINDLETGLTDLWSASKIDSELNLKADDSDLSSHINDTTNPHNVTKSQVGLGDVDNTSDLDKPISNDTQNALDLKANDADISVVGKTGDYNDLNNKPDLSALEEVLVLPTLNDFPATGEAEKVYIAEDTGYMYRWNGTDYTQLTDQTAIWGQISGTLSDQTDLQSALNLKADDSDLSAHANDIDNPHNVTKSQIGLGNVDNIQQATKTEFDAHENDLTIHFTEGSIDHVNIQNIGINTHAQIDAHISDSDIHFTQAQISVTESQISDLDKYTQLEVDNLLDEKTDDTDFQAHANDSTIHFTEGSIDHANIQNIGVNTHAQIDSHIADDGKHREIDDLSVEATDLWSASKINSELDSKADDSDLSAHVNDSTIHFTEGGIDHTNIQNIGVNTHIQIDSHISDDDKHREINDLGNGITDLWSASKIDFELSAKANDSDLNTHVDDTDNPHAVTKSQVGLGNVDNTSDLDKPISNDTQSALDLKANDADISTVGKTGNYNDLNNKPDLSALEEVLVFPTLNDFPATGESEKVYIAEDTGYMYRWNGNDYTQLTDQTAIWGQISGTLSDQTDLQSALNDKADDSDLSSHVNDTDNPHSVTKSQVGLGNVDDVQQATKVEFDSHANDSTIHFTQAQINITESQISDLDKYTQVEVDNLLDEKTDETDFQSHVDDSTIHFTEGSIDHVNIQNIGVNTHAQIDSHISDLDRHREINDLENGLTDLWSASKIDSELNDKADDSDVSAHINDSTIHFTQAQISIAESQISDLDKYTQLEVDNLLDEKADDSDLSAHTNDSTIHFTQGQISITESQISDLDKYTQLEVDNLLDDKADDSDLTSHVNDSTIHFTEGSIDHTNIQNIGINTHAQIDTHISNDDKHREINDLGNGITDLWSASKIDSELNLKADDSDLNDHVSDSTIHFTESSIDHVNIQNIGINTHTQIDSHISDDNKHREINDLGNETTDLWSASKIDSELNEKAEDSDLSAHTSDSTIHFTEGSIDHTNIQNIGVNTHTQIDAHISDDNKHREINDLETGLTDLWSASKIDSELNLKADDSDLSSHVNDTDNPHAVTKSQVGLGNVDNTSDLDKPISNDTQNALDLKANDADISTVGKTGDYNDLNNKPDLSALEEVLVFPTLNDFPVTGEVEKVYIAEDTGYMYRWNGSDYTQLTDQTAIWGQISGALSDQTDLQSALNLKADDSDLSSHINDTDNPHAVTKSQVGLGNVDNVQQATKTEFDSHASDSTIHFTEGSIDHTNIQNIGINTHAQIDSHISDSTIHFTQAQISITESQISDLDKYTQLEVDNLLDDKAEDSDLSAHTGDSTIHFTESSIDHANIQNIGVNTHTQIDSHISDDDKHREINDLETGLTDLWSASKIDSELNEKADDSDLSAHVSDSTIHFTQAQISITESQISDLDKYTQLEVDNLLDEKADDSDLNSHANDSTIHFTEGSIDHTNIQNIGINTHAQIDSHIADDGKHREINDLESGLTDLWSASKIDSELSDKADDLDLSAHVSDTDNPHSVTKSQVGLSNVDNVQQATKTEFDSHANDSTIHFTEGSIDHTNIQNIGVNTHAQIDSHISNDDKHREINDLGNGITDLWSASKIDAEFNDKADDSDLSAHVNDTTNPHAVTKSQVGLGNVDNTSDLDKPISNDTQNALDLKANDADISTVGKTGDYSDLNNKPDLSVLEEVLVFPTLNDFPVTGEVEKVYIAEDTGYMYRWNGNDYTQLTDQTAIWGQISGTLSDQTDLQSALNDKADDSDLSSHVSDTDNPHNVTKSQVGLSNVDNVQQATKVEFDSHANDSTIHFAESSIDHTNIQNIGINTHAQIDSHISDDDIHFTQAQISITESQISDLDKYTQLEVNNLLDDKADDSDLSSHTNDSTIHFTESSIDHVNIQNVGVNTHSQIDSHISDDDKHREINDIGVETTDLWSASKIDSELNEKADDSDLNSHTNDSTIHFAEGSIDHANIQNVGVNTHSQIDSHISDDDKHRKINDLETGLTDLWSASKIDSELSDKANDSDLSAHVSDLDNPHNVTKSQVGLSNVDNVQQATKTEFDSHANDSTIHFTEGSIDHTNIQNIGVNTHAQIDTHISNEDKHREINDLETGLTDLWSASKIDSELNLKADDSDLSAHTSDTDNPHAVTKSQVGLGNVDNIQQATKTEFDSHTNDSTIHFTEGSIDHTNIQNIGVNTHAQIDSHISDDDKHREINDLESGLTDLWSASKIDSELNLKADDSDLSAHVSDTDNPHSVTKSQVGLSNVDNVQQATKTEFDSHANDSTIHFTENSIDHTNIQNIGVNTHAQIDSHISDSTIHFTQAQISITESQISDLDKYTQLQVDNLLNDKADETDLSAHVNDSTIHFTQAQISITESQISDLDKYTQLQVDNLLNDKADDSDLSTHVNDTDNPHSVTKSQVGLSNVDNVQQATKTEFDSHANDSTIHFTEGSINHDSIQNIGINTHAQIDSHISDSTIHFTQAQISVTESQISDLDKYTQLEVDNLLDEKADDSDLSSHTNDSTIHFTEGSIDHANIQGIGVNTHTQIDAHISDDDRHREINDLETGLTDLWSASKISSDLNLKADDSDLSSHINDVDNPHAVTKSQVGLGNVDNAQQATKVEFDSHANDSTIHFTEGSIDHVNIQNVGVNTHAQIDSHIADDDKHREINDLGSGITDLWSASKIDSELNEKADDSDLSSHVNDTTNPHAVTKSQVGLGNVDNTSDLDKPISNDTQNALDLKANDADISTVGKTGDYSDLNNKPDLSVLEEVLVFPTLNDFPATGETEKVYIAEDTGYMYRWNGADYTQLTDQTAIWGQISGTLSDQTDLQSALNLKADDSDLSSHINDTDNPHNVTKSQVGLSNVDNVQQATKTEFDSHANDSTIHFTENSIDHTNIQNIGVNTHAQIDSHISDSTIHFTQAQISITESQISDLDKYTQLQVDNLLDGKADDSDLSAHVNDSTIHFTQAQISITESQISDLDKYTQLQVDNLLGDYVPYTGATNDVDLSNVNLTAPNINGVDNISFDNNATIDDFFGLFQIVKDSDLSIDMGYQKIEMIAGSVTIKAENVDFDGNHGKSAQIIGGELLLDTNKYLGWMYSAETKIADGLFSGDWTFEDDVIVNGNVGIGTTSPSEKLHVAGTGLFEDNVEFQGTISVDEGILSEGTTTGFTIPSGSGTRMMWIPDKAAFRAGEAVGSKWDSANIGAYSFATGLNSEASGNSSSAMGGAIASGNTSFAFGAGAKTSGVNSVAIGSSSIGFLDSKGLGSILMATGIESGPGYLGAEADGKGSIFMGLVENAYGIANGDGAIAMGRAIGSGNALRAVGNGAIAMGENVEATANNAIALGKSFENSVANSFAVGFGQKDFEVKSGEAHVYGDLFVSANITANAFVTDTGTSSDFVKGDGSLDSNDYSPVPTITSQTVSGNISLSPASNGQVFNLTLQGDHNITINDFPSASLAATITIVFVQDGTGERVPLILGNVSRPGGVLEIFSANANAIDTKTYQWDGSKWMLVSATFDQQVA